jgi:hypothetical protein
MMIRKKTYQHSLKISRSKQDLGSKAVGLPLSKTLTLIKRRKKRSDVNQFFLRCSVLQENKIFLEQLFQE